MSRDLRTPFKSRDQAELGLRTEYLQGTNSQVQFCHDTVAGLAAIVVLVSRSPCRMAKLALDRPGKKSSGPSIGYQMFAAHHENMAEPANMQKIGTGL